MQFKIKRTSCYDGSNSPCIEAALISEGKFGSKEWEVTIDTLEQLVALGKRLNENIIVCKDNSLEIYDDYRE